MTNANAAIRVIEQAEQEIRNLVAKAVLDAQFAEAKVLIDVAADLARLREGLGRARHSANGDSKGLTQLTPRPSASVDSLSMSETSEDDQRSNRTTQASQFPRFERDGDRLVKVGWSARDKRTYEHRLGRDALLTVCRHIAEKARTKRPFKMEKLLPVVGTDGEEVPNYQAYLVLKWLQHFDAVERRGKDGYVLKDGSVSQHAIEALWLRTPERSNA